jgi:hypothetical protein
VEAIEVTAMCVIVRLQKNQFFIIVDFASCKVCWFRGQLSAIQTILFLIFSLVSSEAACRLGVARYKIADYTYYLIIFFVLAFVNCYLCLLPLAVGCCTKF